MSRSRNALLAAIRGGALGLAVIAMLAVDAWVLRGAHADIARVLVALAVLGAVALMLGAEVLLPRRLRGRPILPMSLLAVDLVAIGWVGTFLRVPEPAGAAPLPSLPFLAGYLIATLVAVTGRRAAAASLGVLAGAMMLLLGESGFMRERTTAPAEPPSSASAVAPGHAQAAPSDPVPAAVRRATERDPSGPPESRDVYLLLRLLLVAVAAFECAAVTGWMDEDARRRRTAETVTRELRARELVASEMATFVAAAKGAGSLRDLGEALVSHLRRHFVTGARAVFLEDSGERVALWEEAGHLDEQVAETRRLRLQDALKEVGSAGVVPRIESRSTGGAPGAARPGRLLTGVGVAIHATGRVGGVLFVGDTRRDVLAAERLGALAELGRQAGEAMRRLEHARDEQTRRTSLLLGQMHEGVLLLGPDARVLLSNPAGRAMTKALRLAPEAPVSLGEAKAPELAAVPAGTVRRFTLTAPGEGGRSMTLTVAAVGVVDAGTRLGTLVTLTDVTEEEQARRRLMQAEKMSVVGQTLASVAHELNNPLAAIVGYADLLNEADVPPETARLLSRIREQATRTSRIVKNLLNVARRRGPERARVSLQDVVTSVLDLFAYEARLSNIAIETEFEPDVPPLLADRHALQQVLVNLVQNAIHALRHRGKGGQISVRTWRDRSSVCLEVVDDGPGIAPEARGRVFDAFFTTKGPDEGTGLGLAISRTIAREHGGDLGLEQREDGLSGARFVMRLPLDASPAPAPPPSRAIPDGVPARVLVVDDEAAVRDSLVATLGNLGAHADGIATPGEATRVLSGAAPYDAVLMDVRMPGQSGLDVHRAVKSRNPSLARRIVFMTGDLVNDNVLQAIQATGNPFLEKPFTSDELREVLGRATAAGR